MLKKIKNILLYLGVDKSTYNLVAKDINNANILMISIFSGLGTVLIGVMCVISIFFNSASQNHSVYIAGFVASAVLFLLAFLLAKKISWLIVPLVIVSYSIFFLYGIFIGTITNPSQQTVTFMVFLVFMPILFIDRPIRSFAVMLIYIIIFIVLCYKNKTGNVLSIDVIDAIIYGLLGFSSGTIINHIKIRKYSLEHSLQDAWRLDQLTKTNNRNSFEADLKILPSVCNQKLACIYVDVNGLHELNNSKGHLQGDIMLQYVADKMKQIFGKDYTYRIGGDEFVAFVVDKKVESIGANISTLNDLVSQENYHVAAGFDFMSKANLNIEELIKSAETMMYQNKKLFYQDTTRDRRKSR